MDQDDLDILIDIFGVENVVVFDEVKTMSGTVVRLMSDKGFGFLRGTDGKDYFFHRADFHGFFDDLVSDFDSGRRIEVTFEIVQSPKGPRAADVTRTDGGV